MRKKICFIINPISGIGKQKVVETLIAKLFNSHDFEVEIKYTTHAKHATTLSRNAVLEKFDTVVAIGGDGSVNEVSCGLIQSGVKLGIVPCGSGNGFARHLGIPMDLKKSLELIRNGNFIMCDTVKANEEYFVNIAGLGFDAQVAHLFADYGKRGLMSYVKIIFNHYFQSEEQTFSFEINNSKQVEKAFIFSVANASQYGNNATISPLSNIQDGKIELVLLKKIPFYLLPITAFRLFNKSLKDSTYYQHYSASKVKVVAPSGKIHLDGEAIETDSEITFEVLPLSLAVLVP